MFLMGDLMNPLLRCILISLIVVSCQAAHATNTSSAGLVKSLEGDVRVERNGQTITALPGSTLMQGDVIQTGSNGKVGLILYDDTVISMGFNSKIALDSFLFDPNEKQLSLVTRIFSGTMTYISGQIAKLAPSKATIETPYATIGSRGTHLFIKVEE